MTIEVMIIVLKKGPGRRGKYSLKSLFILFLSLSTKLILANHLKCHNKHDEKHVKYDQI